MKGDSHGNSVGKVRRDRDSDEGRRRRSFEGPQETTPRAVKDSGLVPEGEGASGRERKTEGNDPAAFVKSEVKDGASVRRVVPAVRKSGVEPTAALAAAAQEGLAGEREPAAKEEAGGVRVVTSENVAKVARGLTDGRIGRGDQVRKPCGICGMLWCKGHRK
jgi:hypothetical protein